MGSHECSVSGNPSRIVLSGRDGYSLTRKSEKEPRNGSTRTDRYRCRSVAPSVAKARDSHERYAFRARNGDWKSTGGPENPHVGVSTCYLWRGETR